MMLIPQQAEADSLRYYVNKTRPEDLVLRLYSNDVTPTEEDTSATFTEGNHGGYAPKPLKGSNWSEPVQGSPSFITYPEQTFNFTGPSGRYYGYYMTRAISGKLAGAGRFEDGPYTIQSASHSVKVTPTISCH